MLTDKFVRKELLVKYQQLFLFISFFKTDFDSLDLRTMSEDFDWDKSNQKGFQFGDIEEDLVGFSNSLDFEK